MEINLKDLYPFISEDQMLEVNNDVFEVFKEFERQEKNYREKVRRNRAYYSLDRDDGIENSGIIIIVNSPAIILEQKELEYAVLKAINLLPRKQSRRIYKYFYLDMTMTEIALQEKVHLSRVSSSISLGLKKLHNLLKEFE